MKSKLRAVTVLKKNQKEKSQNHRKAAHTRRQRGYHWEDTIVKRFNSVENWNAFRLGSPSTALPDVLAVNTKESTIFTIEAKSGTTMSLPVPADQIERCLKWINTFDIYKKRKVLLAFKFLSKKRIGLGTYESRELREFYKVWDNSIEITNCSCTYDGKTFAQINGERKEINLEDHHMPFKTKFRTSA
ncbi:MAG: resolvase [Nitrosopumilus sp.]|nr:resolvase [Nitrosopumilus sp.]MDH3825644.1 resolvase [Nitrosopumilus sp.]